ncbi:MAG: hypothetical protein ABIG66_03025, partial [Candidatus Kerfeldbacteria bacterium]
MAIDTNKIHKHLQKITHINTGLAVAGLIGIAFLFIWLKWFVEPTADLEISTAKPAATATTAAEDLERTAVDQDALADDYRDEINTLLGSFDFRDAGTADTLAFKVLELTVPAEYKTLHLKIVITLNKAQSGEYDEARSKIEELRGEYSW